MIFIHFLQHTAIIPKNTTSLTPGISTIAQIMQILITKTSDYSNW